MSSFLDNLNFGNLSYATLGGTLICAATTIHLALKGRVTGMSGIFHGLITNDKATRGWKLSCLAGMVGTTALLYKSLGHNQFGPEKVQFFDEPEKMVANLSIFGFGLGGFLVGAGSKMQNGCTSGHGVCGLPRFTKRSWLAVSTFLVCGLLTSTFRDKIPLINQICYTEAVDSAKTVPFPLSSNFFAGASILTFGALMAAASRNPQQMVDLAISFGVGSIFATGLTISGMLRRSKVTGFLTLDKNWNPSLLFVLAAAVTGNIFTFYYIIKKRKKPILGGSLSFPPDKIDGKLVSGAVLFGSGWGLSGLCPGPAINLFPLFTPHIGLVYMGCFAAGQLLVTHLEKQQTLQVKQQQTPNINQSVSQQEQLKQNKNK